MVDRCPYCGGRMRWSRWAGMYVCMFWSHAARQVREAAFPTTGEKT